ncbi:hypothetical protein CWO91_13585 [Bradyrhizobium genosp. SA-3]|uniref:hypothetical protein n=1 Tax=Bradyrhizobium genosp. SA-3 TaxID=508868 RepID=UPI00102A1AA6|nr:hypothetical protein [Bradyrhizobium genosp. SA-3]RZN10348.1 hypothetical protein CWO91_13585 [Bradyrhizobium genosp. SA-3]
MASSSALAALHFPKGVPAIATGDARAISITTSSSSSRSSHITIDVDEMIQTKILSAFGLGKRSMKKRARFAMNCR